MTTNRPNILVITTDQQRGDCLGIEGHPVLQTPWLDWIAASGVRFSRAYSANPICVAARRTMITGRKPANHGMLANGSAPIPWPTLPGELQKAGYQTHLVGKSHWGPPPEELGFESMNCDSNPGEPRLHGYQKFLRENGVTFPRASSAHGCPANGWPARSWHLDEHLHLTSWTAHSAIEFLESRDTARPFFLMVNFLQPHLPLIPPQFYWDKYMAMDLPEPYVGDWARVFDGPVRGLPPECWRVSLDPIVMKQMRAGYYGCIDHIDNQIARFFSPTLLPANTVILFASDHGEMLGDHQWIRKRTPFEPSARVPFLMKFPAAMGLPQEQVIDRPIELMDMMPTLLEVAGVEIPDTVDGSSLLPIIRDSAAPWREYLHGENNDIPTTDSGMQYLTDGQWKYIWLPGRDVEHLFDLRNDPREMVDLAGDAAHSPTLMKWRDRLIRELEGRVEGFTDGKRLLKRDGITVGRLPLPEFETTTTDPNAAIQIAH